MIFEVLEWRVGGRHKTLFCYKSIQVRNFRQSNLIDVNGAPKTGVLKNGLITL